MRIVMLAWLILGSFCVDIETRGQESPPADAAEAELDQQVGSLKLQTEDRTVEISQRESLALELAGMLDRAAQGAKDPESQRNRWNRAILALDEFESKNVGHPQSRQFQLQAAVYRWAMARSSRRQSDLNPARAQLRDGAIAELDDALGRFRELSKIPAEKGDSFGNNLKFRFAQALTDRADFSEGAPAEKSRLEAEAKAMLDGALAEPSIQGFAHLLKAELLRREGKADAALAELDGASKAIPPPPERQLLGVRSSILTSLKRFDDAIKAIKDSQVDPAAKHLLTVQALLAQRAQLAAGADRYPVESLLFDEVAALRVSPGPDARLALLAVSRARIDPDPRLGPVAWDILADAQEILGDPIRAGALEERAAVRAVDSGHPELAAGFRLKAGALLFRAGKYLEADAVLSRIAKVPGSGGTALRARANILRAVALGRALARNLPGASAGAYKDALEMQNRDFPEDPSSDEARWLLGDLVLAEGQPERAITLWLAISPKSPRWIESRRALASLDRQALDDENLAGEPERFSNRLRQAVDFLDRSIREAPDDIASTELLLLLARLDLLPEARRADDARELADRIGRSTLSDSQRYRVALIRIIALAQLGRYVEAEVAAKELAEPPGPDGQAALVDAVRLLDRSATSSETDLRQRRYGLVMRLLVTPAFARDREHWQESWMAELHMRFTRALLFLGDDRAAKGSLASWKGSGEINRWSDPLLRDLADTYARLNAHGLAIDVQRLRLRSLKAGSTPWLDAKYGLALALYRSGRSQESLQLIDSTSILHPELGGEPLKAKFIRLRQRLGSDP